MPDPVRRRPWSLQAYKVLCNTAREAGYQAMPVVDYLRNPVMGALILRHDVDRFPANAVAMAKVEASLGIRSTYYFRQKGKGFPTQAIQVIAELGHEIGYHYEVLSRANGKIDKALVLLKEDLKLLRCLAEVYTTTAHGSPLSKWDNRRLWDYTEPNNFGLMGDGYRDIYFDWVAYITDTGRTWRDSRVNLRDRVESKKTVKNDPSSLPELLKWFNQKSATTICLQTHPERWNDDLLNTCRSNLWDYASNLAKFTLYTITQFSAIARK